MDLLKAAGVDQRALAEQQARGACTDDGDLGTHDEGS
jgi:hypothetical protein